MTLYEMTDNYKAVLEMAQNPDIDGQAIKDTLESIQGDIKEKADGYAKVIKELDGETDKLTAEIKRLTDRKNTIQNNIAYMKQSLKEAMTETGNNLRFTKRLLLTLLKVVIKFRMLTSSRAREYGYGKKED